ncbi:MAG: alpha/beta hydrolase [Persicimonas sp.]
MAYFLFAGLLTLLQRKVIFPGTDMPVAEKPRLPTEETERWWLETDQGRVEAWFSPGEGVAPEEPGPAVVLAHGNGEVIDDYRGRIQRYVERGISVLLPEFRGYGRSAGDPSQETVTGDFERLHERLAAREEVDAERIAYHGYSLGGAVLAALAARKKPRALILESTFTSVADMAPWLPGAAALVSDPFETLEVVERLDVPILVVHGRRDSVVPFEHGERLAEANDEAEFVDHDGDHHAMLDQRAFWRHVDRLFKRAGLLGDGR